ncbi:hypothetical protein [Opitutus sp. ER46]|uniref:hypothetical protein n=1 Tax=Opitutus sp. ER46 TaxID=2161864 RepID=UPI000D31AC09|nr:hypothetical protein [Opitutus sp. ER46]PTX95737.1 hypothetical protein DB354_10020 [Opitutus sp. ER46]
MKSIGQILASDATAQPAPKHDADQSRVFKVTLAIMAFDEIEVRAVTVAQAFSLAEQQAKSARRKIKTTPFAIRAHVQQLADPRDPSKGTVWVERAK